MNKKTIKVEGLAALPIILMVVAGIPLLTLIGLITVIGWVL